MNSPSTIEASWEWQEEKRQIGQSFKGKVVKGRTLSPQKSSKNDMKDFLVTTLKTLPSSTIETKNSTTLNLPSQQFLQNQTENNDIDEENNFATSSQFDTNATTKVITGPTFKHRTQPKLEHFSPGPGEYDTLYQAETKYPITSAFLSSGQRDTYLHATTAGNPSPCDYSPVQQKDKISFHSQRNTTERKWL